MTLHDELAPLIWPALATWRARAPGELVKEQAQAIAAYGTACRAGLSELQAVGTSREMRLDAARRSEVRQREYAALLDAADAQLRDTCEALGSDHPRAVIAHRNDWYRFKVSERLLTHGIRVMLDTADGATAAATVVCEQPDLVLVEDLLPVLTGCEVLTRVRTYAPHTMMAAQVSSSAAAAALTASGSRAVFTRSASPSEVADELVRCLLMHNQIPLP